MNSTTRLFRCYWCWFVICNDDAYHNIMITMVRVLVIDTLAANINKIIQNQFLNTIDHYWYYGSMVRNNYKKVSSKAKFHCYHCCFSFANVADHLAHWLHRLSNSLKQLSHCGYKDMYKFSFYLESNRHIESPPACVFEIRKLRICFWDISFGA